mmetsp:Transcript_96725/g.282772  ORF Transcript_96725/g.282772 Transcript_96725/m.282772 type:complete len:225 (-) Transcript_96725:442-1116(-)
MHQHVSCHQAGRCCAAQQTTSSVWRRSRKLMVRRNQHHRQWLRHRGLGCSEPCTPLPTPRSGTARAPSTWPWWASPSASWRATRPPACSSCAGRPPEYRPTPEPTAPHCRSCCWWTAKTWWREGRTARGSSRSPPCRSSGRAGPWWPWAGTRRSRCLSCARLRRRLGSLPSSTSIRTSPRATAPESRSSARRRRSSGPRPKGCSTRGTLCTWPREGTCRHSKWS